MVDIHNKKCIKCNDKRPCFNYLNETQPLYCKGCKNCGMVNIIARKCITCNETRPSFNYHNEKNHYIELIVKNVV